MEIQPRIFLLHTDIKHQELKYHSVNLGELNQQPLSYLPSLNYHLAKYWARGAVGGGGGSIGVAEELGCHGNN